MTIGRGFDGSSYFQLATRIIFFSVIVLILHSCGNGGGSSHPVTVSVILAPSDAILHVGESRSFNATVSGSADLSVDWKVEEGAAGGSVTTDGLYTAPQSTGIYHLIAASRADATKSARAVITVNPPAGTLDGGFGSGGKITTPMNSDSDLGVTLAFQPDGKVIVAGYRNNGFDDDFTLARYLPDGSPDPVFGSGGKVITPVGSNNDVPFVVRLQADGKIIVAGTSDNGNDFDFSLVRYNPDGSVDPSFGSAGKVMTPIGGSGDFAIDVAVQSDGKIVVAGAASVSDYYDLALIRYNPDGSLDSGFGAGGKKIIPAGAVFTGLNAIRIQSDGKIVMAGLSFNGTDGDIALWRTNADGSLDPSFGTGGKITTDIMGYDGAYALLLQTDGKILVAGGSGSGFALVRYLPEGSLDTAFGTGGIAVDDGNFLGVTRDGIVLQSNQKIVVAGVLSNWPDPADFVLARYDLNGEIDATFGAGGKTVITTGVSTGNMSGSPAVLMIRSDGKIEAAGVLAQSGRNGVILTRYLADGNLDTSNGSGIMEVTAPGAAPDAAQAVAIQSDDKIVAVGLVAGENGASDLALNRFNRDGSPDSTFGVNGKIVTDFGKGEEGRAVVIQPDGKIVAAGLSFGAGNIADFLVVRYLSDGSLDAGFGEGGKTVTDLGSNTNDVAAAAALQPDGKIVVTGNQESGSGISAAVVRYLPDGRLDPSFGNAGIVVTAIGPSSSAGESIALQSDGKIIVAGALESGGSYDLFLVRYDADGGIDPSFGADGTVTTHFGDSDSATHTLLIQPNGQIILSGFTQVGSLFVPVLARYDSNGSLDAAFGTGGKVIGSPEMSGFFTTAALQVDGKILMAGNSSGNTPGFLLTRFNGDGSIDTTFGVHGQVVTHLGFDRNFVLAIALYPDGKILAAGGGAGIGSDFNLALARYWP